MSGRVRLCAVVAVLAALVVSGSSSARPAQVAGPAAGETPTVAQFCAVHPFVHAVGFWSYDETSFVQSAVDEARRDRRQYGAVAGLLCGMLRRVNSGRVVLVPAPTAHAPGRRVSVSAGRLRRAIRELERLPRRPQPTSDDGTASRR